MYLPCIVHSQAADADDVYLRAILEVLVRAARSHGAECRTFLLSDGFAY